MAFVVHVDILTAYGLTPQYLPRMEGGTAEVEPDVRYQLKLLTQNCLSLLSFL